MPKLSQEKKSIFLEFRKNNYVTIRKSQQTIEEITQV
ncbi:hypothetical protein SAMD00079811_04690 [Scytonema sp. HK-05]|nr:hypothetical protein SAMD00079811_04690 [Scytonema sp. HK-05]